MNQNIQIQFPTWGEELTTGAVSKYDQTTSQDWYATWEVSQEEEPGRGHSQCQVIFNLPDPKLGEFLWQAPDRVSWRGPGK